LPAIRENQEPESFCVTDHLRAELPTGRIDEPVGQAFFGVSEKKQPGRKHQLPDSEVWS
jgi:hypothetical protein